MAGTGRLAAAWSFLKAPTEGDLKGRRRRRKVFDKPVESFEYLVVLDFEWTCDNQPPASSTFRGPAEIIEFPAVLVRLSPFEVIDEMQVYCKPVENPVLTAFCKELTAIEQQQVDRGVALTEALSLLQAWLHSHGLVPPCSCPCSEMPSSTSTSSSLTAPDLSLGASRGQSSSSSASPSPFTREGREAACARLQLSEERGVSLESASLRCSCPCAVHPACEQQHLLGGKGTQQAVRVEENTRVNAQLERESSPTAPTSICRGDTSASLTSGSIDIPLSTSSHQSVDVEGSTGSSRGDSAGRSSRAATSSSSSALPPPLGFFPASLKLPSFAFVTWGDADLGGTFHREAKRKQIPKPVYLKRWINLRDAFRRCYGRDPTGGLQATVEKLGMTFEGRAHSGLVDSRNTAKIMQHMVEKRGGVSLFRRFTRGCGRDGEPFGSASSAPVFRSLSSSGREKGSGEKGEAVNRGETFRQREKRPRTGSMDAVGVEEARAAFQTESVRVLDQSQANGECKKRDRNSKQGGVVYLEEEEGHPIRPLPTHLSSFRGDSPSPASSSSAALVSSSSSSSSSRLPPEASAEEDRERRCSLQSQGSAGQRMRLLPLAVKKRPVDGSGRGQTVQQQAGEGLLEKKIGQSSFVSAKEGRSSVQGTSRDAQVRASKRQRTLFQSGCRRLA